MMEDRKVLTIASHVCVGYVGNSVTTFVLQLMGLDVASLNTVQFSNHAGYRRLKGFRTTAGQISDLYDGLKGCGLDDFGMLLTGYIPSEECVEVVGRIAGDMKGREGGCFWLLDPVMGDQDRLYVSEGVLPVYKSLVRVADLIVPNQFEAELLSGVKVDSLTSLSRAISELHRIYNVPHVIITSVTFTNGDKKMLCAGSSATSSGVPRKFMFNVEIIDGFFSGTGDMFAALTLARFREEAEKGGLEAAQSWRCDDAVGPLELPLCKAIGRVLGSMHLVLVQTQLARDRVLGKKVKEEVEVGSEEYVRLTKASELRLVQCQSELKDPQIGYEAVVLK
ncbi:unnamed protein product [Tuber melanosporum]|uniref:pyridoxal kinase n=1 Tax=Tuber melanosporum (strain Mel28) TaxID=656061 RepID=D5GIZ3_TUBMM|nr:uncharacterized protein GSTUM_00008749001 [Tuber melanosporum]CAZ84486.1 unnamed protein product [Tuber melanosporum]